MQDEVLNQFKINFARKYQNSYVKTIVWLFLFMIAKRIIMNKSLSTKELIILLGSLSVFLILSRMYGVNRYTTTYFPYLYAILSYYSHAGFIFKGTYDCLDDPSRVEMSKDVLFRHIVQFAALGINVIFMGIFLVITRLDCILLNIMIWSMYIYDIFQQKGTYFPSDYFQDLLLIRILPLSC